MLKDRLAGHMEIFHSGERYAATSRELERAMGVSGATLRRLVNALRREGVPIASDDTGYYYAETEQEVRRTIAHMKHRIFGISAAIHGLEKSLERYDTAQTRLPLEGGDDL
jgi:predicted DNA-binding transcriptional regulator YafY